MPPTTRGILLIGGAGLVGSHLRAALAGRDDATVTTRSGGAGALALNVRDGAALGALIRERRPRVVLRAAAPAFVEGCETDPAGTRASSVTATEAAAEAARAVDAALVVLSSEYVFPGGAGRYGEDAPVAPLNEYGRQKVAVEDAARRVPRHVVARTSGVYGWEPRRVNFVSRLVDTLRRHERYVVPDDQVITPTHAADLATALLELVAREAWGTFHVAGPETVARMAFAELAAATFGVDPALLEPRSSEAIGYRARRPLACGLDNAKLRATLGHGLRSPAAGLRAMREAEPA
ncbi:MAG: NAD(P)-dependent oxidoreductase [Chloroflexi bacterium]|nr:NAD(P)-dependent oxidoreductase [Chloroflexota bacterium]